MEQLSSALKENREELDRRIGVGRSFDVIARDLFIGGREARLYVLDGYGDDGVIERILSFLLDVTPEEMDGISSMDQLIAYYVTFGEVSAESRLETILTGVFSGQDRPGGGGL